MVGQSKRLNKSKADVQCNITGGQTIQIREQLLYELIEIDVRIRNIERSSKDSCGYIYREIFNQFQNKNKVDTSFHTVLITLNLTFSQKQAWVEQKNTTENNLMADIWPERF